MANITAATPAALPGAQPAANTVAANPAAAVGAIGNLVANTQGAAADPRIAGLLGQAQALVGGGAQPGAAATQPAAGTAGTANLNAQNTTAMVSALLAQGVNNVPTSLGVRDRPLSAIFEDLGKISSARQQRLKDIYIAIAADAQATGSYNQLALQRVQRETSVEEQSSTLMKSVFDKLNNAIQAWTSR